MSFASSGADLFAGTWWGGVFLSTNNGANWTSVSTGLPSNTNVGSLAVDGTNLFAGVSPGMGGTVGGVFVSSDSGASWTKESLASGVVRSLAFSGANFIAGTGDGVFLSTNDGMTWTVSDTGLTNTNVMCLANSDTNLFAGTYGGGVFLSSDNGTSWTTKSTGLTETRVMSLISYGESLFAGMVVNVWRRPLSEMITSVRDVTVQMPSEMRLDQNYPNPFNPSTTIRYALPMRTHVTLTVFNTLGQQVVTLVNESQDAGYHDVRFDGSGLASGVYFYRLQVGTYAETKKLLILR